MGLTGKLEDGKVKFHPSAALFHPLEKRLYLISNIGKLLLIAESIGNIDEVYRLDPKIYEQPEGIAFTRDGTMYISNESKKGKPTLLKFSYKNKGTAAGIKSFPIIFRCKLTLL